MLAVTVTLAELCRQTTTPLPADPDASAEYTAVGDEARAQEDLRIAVTAYRKAVALDSANRHAADALREICSAAGSADETLLQALGHYRRGDTAGATRMLDALQASEGSLPAGAHFVLGLIALDNHDRRTAERELALVQGDPVYGALARDLLRLAHRDGAIAATLLVGSELDTNPQQLPDTPPMNASTGPRTADESLLVVGAFTVRPHRAVALRNVLAWRKQHELDQLDFLGESAQASVELGHGATRASILYDFDADLIGGQPYLLAHRAMGAIRHDLGATGLRASSSVRRRDYLQPAQSEFTGWVYGGEVGVLVHLGLRAELEADALGWREQTADPVFSTLAGGGRIGLRARPASRLRLAANLATWYATFDAPQPDGQRRRDVHVEGAADLEVDIADNVILLVGANAARNASSVEDFRYWKLVARGALAFTIGGL